MTHLFRVAKQNRIFQDVVEQIQEAIIDGHLKVGDRLPAERELKAMLQTSRSTLREALRVLEQKGSSRSSWEWAAVPWSKRSPRISWPKAWTC
jgi:DNA-binding transcriptional regulator YhcF (GntR family)